MEAFMGFPHFLRRAMVLGAVGLAFLMATGCSSQKKSLPREQSGLKKISRLYGKFLTQSHNVPPANEAEFKKFVHSLPPADVKSFGIDESDRIFTSERDGKPYVILYGQPQGPPGPAGSPVIAHEQEGKDGKRWVASAMGAVEEVSDARFRELVPAAK
jgi:hypothetical protein